MLKECLENEEYAPAFKRDTTVFYRIFVYSFNTPAAKDDK
jgi:hypothetical protein